MLSHFLVAFVGLVGVTAQLPSGVAVNPGEWISILPLPCSEGCMSPAGTYYVCFLDTTLPDRRITTQAECDAYLCENESYNHLVACLNCIVANGNARPLGYHTNTALTAPATDEPFGSLGAPVGGYVDVEGGNGWLRNVTERCNSAGLVIGDITASLTASPTTTGPYQTGWLSGETINIPTWTGLEEYSNLFTPSDLFTDSGPPAAGLSSPSSLQDPRSAAASVTTDTTRSAYRRDIEPQCRCCSDCRPDRILTLLVGCVDVRSLM